MIPVDVWFGDGFIDSSKAYGHKTYESWASALRSEPDLFRGRPTVGADLSMVDNVNSNPMNSDTRLLLSGWSITEAIRLGVVLVWPKAYVSRHRGTTQESEDDKVSLSLQIREEIEKYAGRRREVSGLFSKYRKVLEEVVNALRVDNIIGARLTEYGTDEEPAYTIIVHMLDFMNEDEGWMYAEMFGGGVRVSFFSHGEWVIVSTVNELRKLVSKAIKDPEFAEMVKRMARRSWEVRDV